MAAAKKTGRGRPIVHTAEQQWARVVAAFAQLMDQRKLDAHSMDDIAKMAGMSKRTLYSMVPSKEALVVRLIEQGRLSATSLLDEPVTSAAEARATLERFLIEWVKAAYAPSTINIIRLAMDERRAFPAIGIRYFTEGADFITNRLKVWLREQVALGHFTVEDPALVAELISENLISRDLMAVAFGHRPAPSTAKIRARVRVVLSAWGL
jgi:AcrR family transcriptional regulator